MSKVNIMNKPLTIKTKFLYKDSMCDWYINSDIGSIGCDNDGDFSFTRDFYGTELLYKFEVEKITTREIEPGDIIIYTDDIESEIELNNIYFCNGTNDRDSQAIRFLKTIKTEMLDTGLFDKNSDVVYRIRR